MNSRRMHCIHRWAHRRSSQNCDQFHVSPSFLGLPPDFSYSLALSVHLLHPEQIVVVLGSRAGVARNPGAIVAGGALVAS